MELILAGLEYSTESAKLAMLPDCHAFPGINFVLAIFAEGYPVTIWDKLFRILIGYFRGKRFFKSFLHHNNPHSLVAIIFDGSISICFIFIYFLIFVQDHVVNTLA